MQTIQYEIVSTDNPIGIENCAINLRDVHGHEADTMLHWHYALEITLVLEGGIRYIVNGKHYLANAGDFVFINSGAIHLTQNASGCEDVYALTLLIPDSFIQSLVPDISAPYFNMAQESTAQKIIATYLYQITTYMKKPQPFQELLIRKEMISIIYQLFSKCYVSIYTLSSEELLSKHILEYVKIHYAEDISIERISSLFNLQKNYFCRYFKKKTGMSFHQYLCRVRLYAALALISTGDYSVLDAALECGFSSQKLLNDWCKKIYGCTPQQYKKLRDIKNV